MLKQLDKIEAYCGLPDIGIPAEVFFHPELSSTEKLLFGLLRNLSQTSKGCWASNAYLGTLLGIGVQATSNAIAKLKHLHFIIIELQQVDEKNIQRHIFIDPIYPQYYRELIQEKNNQLDPLKENLYTPIKKIIGGYKKTYSKDVREDVRELKSSVAKSAYDPKTDPEIFIETFPEEFRHNRIFRMAWRKWVAHRKEIGKPLHILKTAGRSMIDNKIVPLGVESAIEMIEYTIEKGWIGLVEPKFKNQMESKEKPKEYDKIRPNMSEQELYLARVAGAIPWPKESEK